MGQVAPTPSSRRRVSWRQEMAQRVESKGGRLRLSSRYHCRPHRLERDYAVSQTVLGTGANGEVKMAERSGKKYAVKSFETKHLLCSDRSKDAFRSEVEMLLSVDHPHIVTVSDVYEDAAFVHVVMDSMEGGDVHSRVKDAGRFEERKAAEILQQMLLAVSYLHKRGIAHCDLKLENFLFESREKDHVMLADFGLSQMCQPGGSMRARCGTLAYSAPEVLRQNYTSQCDMWSLGVIAFMLLSGKAPFYGPQAQLYEDIARASYSVSDRYWQGISEEAKDFVRALLQVDPSHRLTADAALDHPWIIGSRAPSTVSDEDVGSRLAAPLSEFAASTELRRAVTAVMAWSLPTKASAEWRDIFLQLDASRQGLLTLGDLRRALGGHCQDRNVREIFAALDVSRDGLVPYAQFLAACACSLAGDELVIQEAFRRFDTSCAGHIQPAGLQKLLGVEKAQAKLFMSELDPEHTKGKCRLQEFGRFVTGELEEAKAPKGCFSFGFSVTRL